MNEMEQTSSAAEGIRTQGYTVIPEFLDTPKLEKSRTTLDQIFEREKGSGKNPEERLTDTYRISFMLALKSGFSRRLCLHPEVNALCRELLGAGYILSTMNGFAMLPGGKGQPLHIDQDESTPGILVGLPCVVAL